MQINTHNIKPKKGIQYNYAHPLAQGIVSNWAFNEGGGTVIYDIKNRSGTLGNFALAGSATSGWVGSYFGGGLLFDGSNDYVTIGTFLQQHIDYNIPFSISICFTFYTFSGAGTYSLVAVTEANGAFFDQFELNISANKVRAIFIQSPTGTNNGRIWDSTDTQGFEINKTYCITWTYDGLNTTTSTKFYKNGVPHAVTNTTNAGDIDRSLWTNAAFSVKDIWVGRRNYSTGDQPFPGVIDSLRVYNRVLGDDEIKTLYGNPYIDWISNRSIFRNPTLYGLGAWKGDLINAGASGTLTADSVDNTVEAAMALSFKKA